MVKRTSEDIYTEYYLSQAGSGFGSVYSGPIYQKGHGIGSFLGGLFRTLFPLLKTGSAAVGKELLKTGANIISDTTQSQDPQLVINRRGKETINNLGRMFGEQMFGAGYKSNTNRKRGQSKNESRPAKKRKTAAKTKKNNSKAKPKKNTSKKTVRKTNKRSKSDILDIFS